LEKENRILKENISLKTENEQLKRELDHLRKELKIFSGPNENAISQKYKAVAENAPWGIFISIPDKFVVEVNEAACDIFGYSREEFIGKQRDQLVVIDEAYKTFLEKRRTIGKAKARVTGIKKDGSTFPMEFSSKTFTDPETGLVMHTSVIIDLTDQIKEEQQKKLILESILDYFYVLDNEFNFTYLNPSSLKLFGVAERDLIGKNLFEVFPVLKEGLFFEMIKTCLETQQPVRFQYFSEPIQTWLDETFYPGPDGISVFFKDINDVKKAEQELEAQKQFFVQTFRQSGVSTILFDKDGNGIDVNERFEELFHLHGARESIGQYNYFQDPLVVQEGFDTIIKEAVENKEIKEWEYEFRFDTFPDQMKAGKNQTLWLSNICYPILDIKGSVTHFIIQHKDITEQKLAEKALRESETKYRLLIENMDLGLMEVDNHEIIQKAYPKFCKIVGYSQEELLGKNAREFLGFDIDKGFSEQKIKQRLQGESDTYEITIRSKTGEVLYLLVNGTPIYNVKGEVTGSLGIHYDLSARKKAEKELKAQKELAQTILANIPIMIVFYDKDGNPEFVNETWEKELGQKLDEIKRTDNLAKALFPESEMEEKAWVHLGKNAGLWEDFKMLGKSGKTIDTTWTNVHLSDGRSIGIGQNITARKQAENQLKQSNERFELVTKATFDAIWDTDLMQGKNYWGEGFFTLFGYKPEVLEKANQPFLTYIHPDDVKNVEESFNQILESGQFNWEAEYRFRQKNGEYAFVIDRAIITRDQTGKAVRITGAMHDISRQKTEEQRLKLLESAITHSTDGILILEVNRSNPLESPVIFSNKAFSVMTGFSISELVGKNQPGLFSQNADENDVARLNQGLIEFKPFELETIYSKKNGEDFWIFINGIPVTNAKQEISHWVFILRDTSRRKKRELEREQMVKELTRSNKELKQFSYVISHNLRSPLSNLMAISSLIDTETIHDPINVELIEGFKTSTHYLNETLEDLLKVMVIRENKEILLEPVFFESVFKSVSDSIQTQISESKALIHNHFSNAPSVPFNLLYMESIFLNMLTNSLKYAKKDKKPIIFIYSIENEENIQLVFEDNGIGFNMAKANGRIFGLYQKFHNHPDSKGIGLYLVHSQVTSLGGSIEVESEENEGTKFTITFPK
jgi:PAS domain S-box-containing protein